MRQRCINSGHDQLKNDDMLQQAPTLERKLSHIPNRNECEINYVRWVILSGIPYEKFIESFASRIRKTYASQNQT